MLAIYSKGNSPARRASGRLILMRAVFLIVVQGR